MYIQFIMVKRIADFGFLFSRPEWYVEWIYAGGVRVLSMADSSLKQLHMLFKNRSQNCIPIVGPSGSGKRAFIRTALENVNNGDNGRKYTICTFDSNNLRCAADFQRLDCLRRHRNCDGTRNLVIVHRVDQLETMAKKQILKLALERPGSKHLPENVKRPGSGAITIVQMRTKRKGVAGAIDPKRQKKRRVSHMAMFVMTFDDREYDSSLFAITRTLKCVRIQAPNMHLRMLAFKRMWVARTKTIRQTTTLGLAVPPPQENTIRRIVQGLTDYHAVKIEMGLVYSGLVQKKEHIGLLQHVQRGGLSLLKTVVAIRDGSEMNRCQGVVCPDCDKLCSNQKRPNCDHVKMGSSWSRTPMRLSKRLIEMERLVEEHGRMPLLEGISKNLPVSSASESERSGRDMLGLSELMDTISCLDACGPAVGNDYTAPFLLSALGSFPRTRGSKWSPYVPPDDARRGQETANALDTLMAFGPDLGLQSRWKTWEMHSYRRMINPFHEDILQSERLTDDDERLRMSEHVLTTLRPLVFRDAGVCRNDFDLLPS